jgi:aminomethyltransferase
MVSRIRAPFRAQKALLAALECEPPRRRAGFRIAGREVPPAGDAILTDGRPVGIVTSATGVPALDCPLAIGWIDTAVSAPGTAEAPDLGGRSADASVVAMPFLDPERKRPKV